MIRFFLIIFAGFIIWMDNVYAQEETLAKQIRSTIKNEAFSINALFQSGFRYSVENNDFQGGRTFEAANARLGFKGKLDGMFFYSVLYDLISEPNLLDAFIGYSHSDGLQVTAGAMKPKQSPDFIPDPGSTDFIDRAKITGLLVQSREVGLALEGEINKIYYYSGIFNGNKLSSNNNNQFYGIGRLQYSIENIIPGTVKLAIQGSHGNTPEVQSGSSGPVLRGERTIYGADMRLEMDQVLLAAEFLTGMLETVDIVDKKEEISGYYITAGYKFFQNDMVLGRLQSWSYKEKGIRDNQITFGINHNFTSITSFQFNFDSYLPEKGDNQYGFSFLFQVKF